MRGRQTSLGPRGPQGKCSPTGVSRLLSNQPSTHYLVCLPGSRHSLNLGPGLILWLPFFAFTLIPPHTCAGFAAQSLLAALGSVQFVSNVFFASFVLKEKVWG